MIFSFVVWFGLCDMMYTRVLGFGLNLLNLEVMVVLDDKQDEIKPFIHS